MTMDDGVRSPPVSATTRNFRESTHLIPTIKQEDRPRPYEPPQMHLYVVLPASLFMIALGIALEIALHFSQKNQGFHVHEQNVLSRFVSAQFLTSFFPILLVAPLVLLWESKTWLIKRYQPYINLARGDAVAEDSLLLDYISVNSLFCIWLAFTKRHWLVFTAALCGLSTLLLQPLAGSIFEIQQIPESAPFQATSIRQLGLDPDRFQLQAFLAAAGYVLAAVSNGLPDPPFIHQNWAAADFVFPTQNLLNASVSVNTTGIRTNATCSAPSSLNLTATGNPLLINSVSQAGCSISVQVNTSNSNQQYGVTPVQGCGPHANQGNISVLPVFFWFFHVDAASNQQQGAGVFCSPTLEIFHISANASLNDGSLGNVTKYGPIDSTNSHDNVTGAPQLGVPFNGVAFDQATIPDEFAQARLTAIQSGVPGAILRAVTTNVSLAPTAFTTLDGFVDTTSDKYTQFLALVAKNTYYLTDNSTLPATLTSLKPRLVIEPLSAHFLSVILIVIGTTMLVLGLTHRYIRRGVFIASPPGSIASAVALTSHSGFGMFLVPYDTELSIATKLDSLLFRLDKRTGAIVAYDKPGYEFKTRHAGDRSDSEERDLTGEKVAETEPLRRSGSVGSRSNASPLLRENYLVEPFTPPKHPESPLAS